MCVLAGDRPPAVCSLRDVSSRPRLLGHSYFSTDPWASADFTVKCEPSTTTTMGQTQAAA